MVKLSEFTYVPCIRGYPIQPELYDQRMTRVGYKDILCGLGNKINWVARELGLKFKRTLDLGNLQENFKARRIDNGSVPRLRKMEHLLGLTDIKQVYSCTVSLCDSWAIREDQFYYGDSTRSDRNLRSIPRALRLELEAAIYCSRVCLYKMKKELIRRRADTNRARNAVCRALIRKSQTSPYPIGEKTPRLILEYLDQLEKYNKVAEPAPAQPNASNDGW